MRGESKERPGERTLGRYRLLRLLGSGGMGEVHLGCVTGPGGFEKLVAIKVLKHGLEEQRARAELIREAQIAVRLDHEGVVQVLDLGSEEGRHYLVMEYVRGFSLAHVLAHVTAAGEQLPLASVAVIGRSVADALAYMHGLRGEGPAIVHGDVSPSNVLVGADGRIKLSDFGVSAMAHERAAQVTGKWSYLPPEVLTGAPRSPAWDVFGAGAILYEALCGHKAYPAEGLSSMAEAHARAPRAIGILRADCPAALAAALTGALHPDPAQRSSAAALREALDQCLPVGPGELERHRAFVAALYARPAFAAEHGVLPGSSRTPRVVGDVDDRVVSAESLEQTAQLTHEEAAAFVAPVVRVQKPLRFGLTQAHGALLAREHGDVLSASLAARLGHPVRTVVLADYQTLVECLLMGDVDLGWTPPIPFVAAADGGAGLLAVAARQGQPCYRAAIIVHADAPARAAVDLIGAQMAWVARESASGYVFAVAELAGHLRIAELGRSHFLGSHLAVIEAVANGWATAGATYAVCDGAGRVVSSGWQELAPARAAEVRALLLSGEIPADNVAHGPHLSPRLIGELRDVFLGLHREEAGARVLREVFRADAMIAGDISLYQPVREALRRAREAA